MQMVKLRNGSVEPMGQVQKVTTMLHVLERGHWSQLFDLAQKAEQPECRLLPLTIGSLKRTKMLETDGTMSASVRNVVLSAVQVSTDGLEYTLVDPIVQKIPPAPRLI